MFDIASGNLYYKHVYIGSSTTAVNDTVGGRRLIPGDANLDGVVDVSDLALLSANWEETGKYWNEADFTGDACADVSDLGVLTTYWEQDSGKAAIPDRKTLEAYLAGEGIDKGVIEEVLDELFKMLD